MSIYKILIVEDDPMIAESLQDILELLNHEVVGIADNAESAIKFCNEHDPELALLDIQIAGDIDGIDLAELLTDQFDFPIIFSTAFADENTLARAKKRRSFGYLVKPYGAKDVNAAIEVAMSAFDRLKEAQGKPQMPKVVDNYIFLKVDSRLIKVEIDDLLFIEAKGDYALFKTNEKGFIVHTTMKKVQERLEEYKFVKVHRSYVVNLSKIVDIEESNLLIENKVIPISRANKENLIKKLNLL